MTMLGFALVEALALFALIIALLLLFVFRFMFSKIIVPIATFIYSLDVFSAEKKKKWGMPQLNPETFSSQLFWLVVFFCDSFYS